MSMKLDQLGLSNQALFQILSGRVNSQILSTMVESKIFPRFLDYAQTYFRNAMIDFGIDVLKGNVESTQRSKP